MWKWAKKSTGLPRSRHEIKHPNISSKTYFIFDRGEKKIHSGAKMAASKFGAGKIR